MLTKPHPSSEHSSPDAENESPRENENNDEKEQHGYGINIYIGPNMNTTSKEITLPYANMLVTPIPQNPMKEEWADQFEVDVKGKTLTVRRADKQQGWGMQLLLRGYYSRESIVSHHCMFKAAIMDQLLTVELAPNQHIRSYGTLLFAGPGVLAKNSFLKVAPQSNAGKSFIMSRVQNVSAGLKRVTVDKKKAVTVYSYNGDEGTSGTVVLGAKLGLSANIIHLALGEYGNRIIVRRGSFLASSLDVQILDSNFFDKLQAVVGHGDIFLRSRGSIERVELMEGDRYEVEGDSLIAITQEVQTDDAEQIIKLNKMAKRILIGPGFIWKSKYKCTNLEVEDLELSMDETEETRAQNDAATSTPEDDSIDNKSVDSRMETQPADEVAQAI
mmetsp:Transcript_1880/g.2846  ORF Transcript_1880/g.2846 Transcript_1880/m.2846 type:complete len:387 (+) Transcript_1880:30-1190(+)